MPSSRLTTVWPSSRSFARLAVLLLTGVSVAALGACSNEESSSAKPSTREAFVSTASATPDVLATIGDDTITLSDVRARVGDALDRIDFRYRVDRHQLIDTTLQGILRDRVLTAEAEKQKKTVDQLLATELGRPLDPTDLEVNAW